MCNLKLAIAAVCPKLAFLLRYVLLGAFFGRPVRVRRGGDARYLRGLFDELNPIRRDPNCELDLSCVIPKRWPPLASRSRFRRPDPHPPKVPHDLTPDVKSANGPVGWNTIRPTYIDRIKRRA